MPKLSDPIKIRNMEVKNRLAYPPMLSGSHDKKGCPTDRSFNLHEIKARGGVGLITYEATGVDPRFVGGNGSNIGREENIPAYRKMTDMIHKYGAKTGMQLADGGIINFVFAKQYANIYVQPRGPSSNVDLVHATSANDLMNPKWRDGIMKDNASIKELSIEEIVKLEDLFANGAKNVIKSGFDYVEIHSCHGSLYHSFLSPYLNKRTDEYGGSYENKCRFLLETVEKMRKNIGDKPIFVRISGDELVRDGNHLEDTRQIAQVIEKGGVDCIDVTQGVIYRSPYGITIPTYCKHGCYIHLSEGIKKVVDIPVIGVGRIVDPRMADEFIQQGKADIIHMGRQLICDPETPNKYFNGQEDEIKSCVGCLVGCGYTCVQDAFGAQNYKELTQSTEPKKIIILGAGIAGMEAARMAKLRGHEVEIYEKSGRVGGLMPLVAAEYKKDEFIKISNYIEKQLKKLGVPIHLNKELTKEDVDSLNTDILVLAIGSDAVVPVKFESNPNVFTQDESILKNKPMGKNLVVWGLDAYWRGGAETVTTLVEEGYNIKAFVGSEAAVGQIITNPGRRFWILRYLRDNQIPVYTNAKLLDVTEKGVKFINKEKKEQFVEADGLVFCGSRVTNGKKLKAEFEGVVPEIQLIGDCNKPRDIQAAMKDAQTFARNLI